MRIERCTHDPRAVNLERSLIAPGDPRDAGLGIYGILVPGVATNPTHMGAESISFDLPGMSFDEAVRWMEAHLPWRRISTE